MAIVATLLDKARTRRGIPTDMALAERLGRSRAVVSEWRAGKSYPDEDLIVALAELAGDDPGEWLLAIKAVRTDGKAGKVWAALAKRLGAAAAVALCAVGFAIPTLGKADELKASAYARISDSAHCILCKERDGPDLPDLLAAAQTALGPLNRLARSRLIAGHLEPHVAGTSLVKCAPGKSCPLNGLYVDSDHPAIIPG